MKIIEYIKSLVVAIKKPTILEDARITSSELKLKSIPSYKSATKYFKGNKPFEAPENKALDDTFNTLNKGGGRTNLVASIFGRLESMLELVELLTTLADKRFEQTTMIGGITIQKLNIIKLLDSASFISTYSMHLLNYIYVHETAKLTGDPSYIRDNLSPGLIKWTEANFNAFCQLILSMTNEKDVIKVVENIPDVAIGNDPEATMSTLGEKVVNPLFVMGYAPTSYNPIYHVRLMIAEYQVARYKQAVELKTVLELRLLNLEKANDKTPDTKLEQEIAYTQSRVDRLNESIRKTEESVQ